MDKRVVVTGIGLITPLGLTINDNLDALTNGISGIKPISSFDCRSFPVKIAGEITDFNPEQYVKKKKSLKLMNRTIKFAVAATDMAIKDAGLETENLNPVKIGISLGIEGTQYTIDELSPAFEASTDANKGFDFKKFGSEGYKMLNPLWTLTVLPNMSLCHIAINHNIQGPNMTFCSIASGGAQAIGEAVKAIKEDEADIMVAGGCESINPVTIVYLALHNIFSSNNDNPEEACRPFDRDRDGVVIGEGAGILILEELEHALKRDANIYGEIVGYSTSIYGNRLTSKNDIFLTSETGAETCMQKALEDAGMNSSDIDYINADGQSSIQADRAETEAIKRVFGENAKDVFISSTKSMMGHLLCASAATELIVALLCIQNGVVPPTINNDNVDANCDLNYTANTALQEKIDTVMSNSFGLGGENASLIVKRY
ncbi:MAG: beta-ketoacyl-[acyl-carrier-protein] synthase family protein [Candidatus Anammoxibacter sp.]